MEKMRLVWNLNKGKVGFLVYFFKSYRKKVKNYIIYIKYEQVD